MNELKNYFRSQSDISIGLNNSISKNNLVKSAKLKDPCREIQKPKS